MVLWFTAILCVNFFKITKFLQMDSTDSQQDSSLEIAAAVADRSLNTTLPEVFMDLSAKMKSSKEDVATLQQQVLEIQQKLADPLTEYQQLKRRGVSATRQIYLIEEDTDRLKQELNALFNGIEIVINERNDLKEGIECKEKKLRELEQLFSAYKTAMNNYEKKVVEAESQSLIHLQLVAQNRKIEELTKQKKYWQNLSRGKETFEKIQSIIESLRCDEKEVDQELQAKEDQIDKEKLKQCEIKKETEVLEKRNAAMLLRYKRQLKEIQTQSKHCQEQTSELEEQMKEFQTMS